MKLVARIITDEAVDVKTELKDITEEKTASLRRGDICYTEEFIQNKQEVTVIGTAKYNEDYTGLVVTKEGNEPYLIFDNERVILAPLRLGIILVGGMNAVFIAALFF